MKELLLLKKTFVCKTDYSLSKIGRWVFPLYVILESVSSMTLFFVESRFNSILLYALIPIDLHGSDIWKCSQESLKRVGI